jgi:plasmid maintenance system antidote protein VapI
MRNTIIQKEFEHLFAFKDTQDELEHMAQMISFRFLSIIEKTLEDRNLKKADLAKMLTVSKSYITQLFNGGKKVNMDILARLEHCLGIDFQIYNKKENKQYSKDLSIYKKQGKEQLPKLLFYFLTH